MFLIIIALVWLYTKCIQQNERQLKSCDEHQGSKLTSEQTNIISNNVKRMMKEEASFVEEDYIDNIKQMMRDDENDNFSDDEEPWYLEYYLK